MEFQHKSVLLQECIDALNIRPDGIYLDGTLGGAGHSSQIARRLTEGGRLIGVDRDRTALAAAKERLAPYADRVTLVHSNFAEIDAILDSLGIPAVDGMLFDLGVSSPQLDDASRGFSYMADAPLDMRMDKDDALTAGEGKNLLLARDEAFALGHTLGFSLAEMQWFLLRTLDTEDGLRYHASGDLVETFGFVTGMGEKSVAALKARCARMLADIPKAECDGREGDWTRAAGASLPQIAASWPVEEREERFLAWMREQAPYLDRPSRSALRIYRNLAVYAWHIAAEEESAPIESDFLPCIRELVSQPEEDEQTVAALYVNGAISAKKCRAVAGDILLDNLNRSFSDQTDKAKAYHVIAVRPDGQMTVSGGINASRTRVQDLLAGKAEVEKSDMLYLLWFTVGLCWLWNSRPRPSEIYDRLADFIDAAEICLDAAMLPPFYPPHLIEQSMLLSVVYAGRTESDTAEIYEQLCSAVIERRKSKNRP